MVVCREMPGSTAYAAHSDDGPGITATILGTPGFCDRLKIQNARLTPARETARERVNSLLG